MWSSLDEDRHAYDLVTTQMTSWLTIIASKLPATWRAGGEHPKTSVSK